MTRERIAVILTECVADVDRILEYLGHEMVTQARLSGGEISKRWNPSILTVELFKIRIQQEWANEAEASWEEER